MNACKSHYHVYVSFTEIREELNLLYLKTSVGLVVVSDLINSFRALKSIRVQTYFVNIFSQCAPKGCFFWISGFALQYSTRHLWKLRGWLTKSRVALEFRFLLDESYTNCLQQVVPKTSTKDEFNCLKQALSLIWQSSSLLLGTD